MSSQDPRSIEPLAAPPNRTVHVPGSKSHTNRALVCAGLATGRSTLRGALFANDTAAMVGAWRDLGAGVSTDEARAEMVVEGTGGVLPVADQTLDVRQSGTTGRFLLPVLALTPGVRVLDGDPQLRARPFGPLITALGAVGVRTEGDRLPITVHGGGWTGGEVVVAGDVSSQFLSGLLLAAPCATSTTVIRVEGELVSKPYIDLTIATMESFGAQVDRDGHRSFAVAATGYQAADVDIEPDASAASYFFAAAAMTGGRVRVEGLGTESLQGDVGFVDVLAEMGAEVDRAPSHTEVRGTAALRGIRVDMSAISDTAQTLAVVATTAEGPTIMTGIDFIRHKETDRVAAVVHELTARGISATEDPDGMTVHPGRPTPGVVQTYDDHRMAMSFALLGLSNPGVAIADPRCVDKTFPGYFDQLDSLRDTDSLERTRAE